MVLGIAEQIFAVLGLLFFAGAFSDILPIATISLLRYLIWFGAIALLIFRWHSTLWVASQTKLLWVLCTIILFSFLWADVPLDVLRESREVMQMTAFGLYFGMRFTLRDQVKLLAIAFGIGALMSFTAVVVDPTIGIHGSDHPGAWKGVYGYKNILGSMMILGAVSFALLPKHIMPAICQWIGFGLCVVLILLSTSKTSLILSILLAAIIIFYRFYRWRGKITIVFWDLFILVAVSVSSFIFTNWTEIITGLGRDPTLTGRTPMWTVALIRLMERPWLGFGRGMFWRPVHAYAREAGSAVAHGFIPPHGHNGFIDMALDIGLVGLGIFLVCYGFAYIRSLRLAYGTDKLYNLYPLAFLIFLFVNNITESFILYKSNIYWTLFISFAVKLAVIEQETKLANISQVSELGKLEIGS